MMDALDLLSPDDLYPLNDAREEWDPSVEINNTLSSEGKNIRITVSYEYADLNDTSYNFSQLFEAKDSLRYFKVMKLLCTQTINDLINEDSSIEDDDGERLHFEQNYLNKSRNLKDALKKHLPDAISSHQEFFHFALYTDKVSEGAEKDRAPRIYFMLGLGGIIYPIFFDPKHELNPTEY